MQPITGERWAENTLDRACRMSHRVLERTLSRKVEWPSEKHYGQNPVQDRPVYTSLDDVFSSMLQYMSGTTRNCKRYYTTEGCAHRTPADNLHCRRFHTPYYTAKLSRNPIQRSEDVHIVVKPGKYAVSAGKWGMSQQHTHVVHVQDGNTVNVDFVL